MSSLPPKQYVGIPFIFCSSNAPNYNIKQCNGQSEYVLPKKALIYNKPSNTMTKTELLKWASKNKYR